MWTKGGGIPDGAGAGAGGAAAVLSTFYVLIIYINDITSELKSTIYIIADDTTLIASGKDYKKKLPLF